MTYASQQEAASRSLRDLLTQDHLHPASERDVVLECREHAVASLIERIDYLGAGYEPQAASSNIRVGSLSKRPLHHLAHVVSELPRTGPCRIAPSDLLPGPPAHLAVTLPTAGAVWRGT